MRHVFVLFLLVVTSTRSYAQPIDSWQWAVNVVEAPGYLGAPYTNSQRLTVDPFGNTFLLGVSIGSMATPSLVADSGAFLARYDAKGVLSWARKLEGKPETVCASPVGDVYVAGRHQMSYGQAYIEKLDSHGGQVWKRIYSGYSTIYGMSVAPSGNVYVTGLTTGTLSMDGLTMHSKHAFFVAKVNSSGTTMWIRSGEIMPGLAPEAEVAAGYYVAIDAHENVFIACNVNYCSNWSCNTNYLLKLDQHGNYLFHKEYGGYRATCHGLVFEPDGDIIMGHYDDVWTSGGSVVLRRYDSTLTNRRWSLQTGAWQCQDLLMDVGPVQGTDGYIYVGGNAGHQCWFPRKDTLWFGGEMLVTDSLHDIIVCRIEKATGHYDKVWHVGGRWKDGVTGMASDPLGNCYVAGAFNHFSYNGQAPNDTLCFGANCLTGGENEVQVFLARLRLSDAELTDQVGMEDNPLEVITVHPNPSPGTFLLSNAAGCDWQVYDLRGELVMQGERQEIDLSEHTNGVYICRLRTGAGISYHRLVKRGDWR